MIRHRLYAAAISVVLPTVAFAQGDAMVKISQSDQYGQYITDAEGQALYLFTADKQGKGGAEARISCSGECLERWPLFYTDGKPQAGKMVDAAKLGTVTQDGKTVVTYNGWPLYYFFKDEKPGQTTGQDVESFGGEWYLVTPAGEKVGHK